MYPLPEVAACLVRNEEDVRLLPHFHLHLDAILLVADGHHGVAAANDGVARAANAPGNAGVAAVQYPTDCVDDAHPVVLPRHALCCFLHAIVSA